VKKIRAAALAAFLFPAASALNARALELWRHPEAAGINACFLDVRFAELSFTEGFLVALPEIGADFLPFRLPFSAGAFFGTPDPNLKSFGLRAGYHADLGDPKTDLYLLYVLDLGFLRADLLEEYGDTAEPARWYDFRAGVRRLFGKYFCLSVETAYKLRGFSIGASVKIN
jgi:hypothetical protein